MKEEEAGGRRWINKILLRWIQRWVDLQQVGVWVCLHLGARWEVCSVASRGFGFWMAFSLALLSRNLLVLEFHNKASACCLSTLLKTKFNYRRSFSSITMGDLDKAKTIAAERAVQEYVKVNYECFAHLADALMTKMHFTGWSASWRRKWIYCRIGCESSRSVLSTTLSKTA